MRAERVLHGSSDRMICFISRVLLTASHRLWRVLVVSIAAAMTHSLFFSPPVLGRSQEVIIGNILSHAFFRAAKMNAGAAVYALCGVLHFCDLLRRGWRVSDGLRDIVP